VPKEYIPGVEKGINSVMGSGILAGFPVVDVKATLIDGAYHDVDSSALAFEIASRAAFREALQKGGAVLLEPIMRVEVEAPENDADWVRNGLLALCAGALAQDRRGDVAIFRTTAPLANLLGYPNALRSMTHGLGRVAIEFSHYAPVPSRGGDEPFPPAVGMRA
jgi:elongation factor G